jgi:hypothetical protein
MASSQPPRDTSSKPGTAIIKGRVVASDTGQPLRKVMIRASSPEVREGHVTTTDNEGRYELKEMPAGRYTLNASKGSYVSLAYGQVRPFEPGKPLEIADGQTVEKVDFSLPRGGVITGRVVDEFGEAVADANVAPMRFVNQGGRRRLQPSGRMSMTNDIGEYRIFGLPPGQYYISATMRGGAMGAMMNAQSDDRSGYAPTYFPGTGNSAEAQKLTLGLAQTLSDINVTLVPTRIATVSGVALQGSSMGFGGVSWERFPALARERFRIVRGHYAFPDVVRFSVYTVFGDYLRHYLQRALRRLHLLNFARALKQSLRRDA